jgi:hypothetical protein
MTTKRQNNRKKQDKNKGRKQRIALNWIRGNSYRKSKKNVLNNS